MQKMQKDCSLQSRNRRDGPKEPHRIEFASISLGGIRSSAEMRRTVLERSSSARE